MTVTERKIDRERRERTSITARALLETERLAREAKTARLRDERLAAMSVGKPRPVAAKAKPPSRRKKREVVDVS